MLARIFQRIKNATQSGLARTDKWVLQFEPEKAPVPEPLMGWTSSQDMRQQVTMEFDSMEEAVAYAERNNIAYQVFEAHRPAPRSKSYSDNFKFDRKIPWTH